MIEASRNGNMSTNRTTWKLEEFQFSSKVLVLISLARFRDFYVFASFSFTLWSAGTAKFTLQQVLFFSFFDYNNVWSTGRD